MTHQFQMSQEARNTLIGRIEVCIEEMHKLSLKEISFKEISLNTYEKLSKKSHLLSIYLEELIKELRTYPPVLCS